MMGDTKKYGLIISKKKSSVGVVKKGSVFGKESSDEEDSSKAVNVSLLREADKKKQMKQTQIEVQKALAEDPTVYEYDSVYDHMQEKKKPQVIQVAEKDKKPKYIKGLLKSAGQRKLEYERQIERKAQREREAEGEEFADKDAFVTTAYKKKMQEWAEEEERLKRQDLIDAANDVTKQKDLSQFYRNLLNENVSMGGAYEADAEKPSINKKESEEARKERSHSADRETKSEGRVDTSCEKKTAHESRERERQGDSYREHRKHDHHHHRTHSNRSDDSFRNEETRDRRDSRRRDRNSDRRRREVDYHGEERRSSSEKNRESKTDQRVADEENLEKDQEKNNENKEKSKTEEIQRKEQADKQTSVEVSSKFAKRSTGDSVMSARERYLARKAARESSKADRKTAESDED